MVTTDRDKEGFTVIFFLISAVILTAFPLDGKNVSCFSYEANASCLKELLKDLPIM